MAVSGGIDSVALLHMLAQLSDQHQLIVAHFDHGIRDDSHEDARFVAALAEMYGLPFETQRVELGSNASEEQARQTRYAFLKEIAARHNASIVTAHHQDDVVETVAINLHRGTGWRGLATHNADVTRPLLNYSKDQLRQYVQNHNLEWREDSTNQTDAYLRNRVRHQAAQLSAEKKRQILELRTRQLEYKRQIENEVKLLVGSASSASRYFFTHSTKKAAIECLRYLTKGKLTRPQLERTLVAIKTMQPGKIYEAGNGVALHFTTRNFSLSLIK